MRLVLRLRMPQIEDDYMNLGDYLGVVPRGKYRYGSTWLESLQGYNRKFEGEVLRYEGSIRINALGTWLSLISRWFQNYAINLTLCIY